MCGHVKCNVWTRRKQCGRVKCNEWTSDYWLSRMRANLWSGIEVDFNDLVQVPDNDSRHIRTRAAWSQTSCYAIDAKLNKPPAVQHKLHTVTMATLQITTTSTGTTGHATFTEYWCPQHTNQTDYSRTHITVKLLSCMLLYVTICW